VQGPGTACTVSGMDQRSTGNPAGGPADRDVTAEPSPGRRYLEVARDLVDRLLDAEWQNIRAAAELVADALAGGGCVHAFGTGHSHMLAEELFYRAGGLVRVRPILFDGLMLHVSASMGTALERLPGLAEALLADHLMAAGDVVVIASNSGSNAVTLELAAAVHARGARIIAVTSLSHATSPDARATALPRLHEQADVVIDNGGCVGDAAIAIDGLDRRVAPTSTVVGAAILEAVVAEAAGILVGRGITPEVFVSANVEGGDAANARFMAERPGR
jgi:uncharacterized phosphosugar-binding protein